MEGWPSGQWQQTVNLPGFPYEGSNPSPSTTFFAKSRTYQDFRLFCHAESLIGGDDADGDGALRDADDDLVLFV